MTPVVKGNITHAAMHQINAQIYYVQNVWFNISLIIYIIVM